MWTDATVQEATELAKATFGGVIFRMTVGVSDTLVSVVFRNEAGEVVGAYAVGHGGTVTDVTNE